MINSLSITEARKLILLSQKLPPSSTKGLSIDATQSALEHLGYVQIDTISVVARAHHHTLWNRNPRYKNEHLDQLVKSKNAFEYWSHAAAYLPMKDYRFSLPRKHAMKTGKQKHWYPRNDKLIKEVLERIKNEGPLMAKDFDNDTTKKYDWASKPTKQALEYLFMQGDLMIPYRTNFHKVYDLTEHVLPYSVDTSMPSDEEYAQFLITKYLEVNGLAQLPDIIYLLKNTKTMVAAQIESMLSNSELLEINVGKTLCYALPQSLSLLNKPLAKSRLKILSPFDNLVIQRKRMQRFFDFDYLIECYLPANKRQYGYFSLPLLWDGKLVARVDCKADRKTSILHIQHLALEPTLKKVESFVNAFIKELALFITFNNCCYLKIHKTTPANLLPELSALFRTSGRLEV